MRQKAAKRNETAFVEHENFGQTGERESSCLTVEWLTASEAAHYLKVQHRTILSWAKRGLIPAHRLSGSTRVTWRFLRAELDAAMLNPPSAARTGGSIEQQI